MSQIAALQEVAIYFGAVFFVGVIWILADRLKSSFNDDKGAASDNQDENVDLRSKGEADLGSLGNRPIAFSDLRSKITGHR